MTETGHQAAFTDGKHYEKFMGQRSRVNGEAFLSWLKLPNELRWLDVGCGAGALSAVILEQSEPKTVTGIDPSEPQITRASERIDDRRADFRIGNAMALPFEAESFDVAVASYVLNFVPDKTEMISEMARVVRPGGTVAVTVFDYLGNGDPGRHFWEAIRARDGAFLEAEFDKRGWNITQRDTLVAYFTDAGLSDIDAQIIEAEEVYDTFDEYWSSWTALPTAATAQFVEMLDDKERAQLRNEVAALVPVGTDGQIRFPARSWAVRGMTSQ